MSPRKIIFLTIVGIVTVTTIVTIIILGNKKDTPIQAPEEFKIWINEGTTDDYLSIIEGFKKYAPEFSETKIIFEKKTTDPVRYRTLLLSMMSDNMSPDIFMVNAGEDEILQSRIEPIPEDYFDINYFEREYDDIFLSLIISKQTKEKTQKFLLGVPLGFETMGIYYNKNLIREVPNTWDALDAMHNKGILDGIFVSNLGLSPRYTPNASDTIALFFLNNGIDNITDVPSGNRSISHYLSFKDIQPYSQNQREGDIYGATTTLEDKKNALLETKATTLDMFMQGDIGMIFGYPSLVQELEKSDKRLGANKSTAGVILTAKIPLLSPTAGRKNIAKYSYFAISKGTKNPEISVRFLQYLMTPEAERLFLERNSYLIAAQRTFWPAQKTGKLSKILDRVIMDAFIPDLDEKLITFNYGLKPEFNTFLSEYLDRNNNIDISNMLKQLSREITCSTSPYTGLASSIDCEKE